MGCARSAVNQQMHVKLRDRRYCLIEPVRGCQARIRLETLWWVDSRHGCWIHCPPASSKTHEEIWYEIGDKLLSVETSYYQWRQVTIRNASIPACTRDQKLNPDKYEHQSFRGIDMRLGSLRRSRWKMRSLRREPQDLDISNMKHKMNAWTLTVTAKLWRFMLWYYSDDTHTRVPCKNSWWNILICGNNKVMKYPYLW